MGIGVSLFLIAVGAILAFGVEVVVEGANLDAIGVILMIIGAFGLLLSMIFWSSWGGWGGTTVAPTGRRTVVERRDDFV